MAQVLNYPSVSQNDPSAARTLCAVCGRPVNDTNGAHFAPQSTGSAAVIRDSNVFRYLCRES